MTQSLTDAFRVLYGASFILRSQPNPLQNLRGTVAEILVKTGGSHYSSDDHDGASRNSTTKERTADSQSENDSGSQERSFEEQIAIDREERIMRLKMQQMKEGISGNNSRNPRSRINASFMNGISEDLVQQPTRAVRKHVHGSSTVPDAMVSSTESEMPGLNVEAASTNSETVAREDVVQGTKQEDASIADTIAKSVNDALPTWEAKEQRVPESSIARFFGFGSLAAGLAFGAASEGARRFFGYSNTNGEQSEAANNSAFLTDANAERLAASLSRMRGAALKLGQMLSMQDNRLVPPQVLKALERVRQGADIMPKRQLEKVLAKEFNTTKWRSSLNLVHFGDKPVAAASIGQVHKGVYLDPKTNAEIPVALKIQYPGVGNSISSDIANVKRLARYTGMFPDSMYLDEALNAAREELERECNYLVEAENQMRFRKLIIEDEETKKAFVVPKIIWPLTTARVLTSEFVHGVPIDRVTSEDKGQLIANALLKLTLKELFEFRFMQTDPNFSNFLFDLETDKIMLIDHGATREYRKDFVDNYLRLIEGCATEDREKILHYSTELGFLTGEENKVMLDTHVAASIAVGEPFQDRFLGGYPFKNSDIAVRTAQLGRTMLRERLCPPPKEAYSLHRRLSGAFLTCGRLNATVDAASMLRQTLEKYEFGNAEDASFVSQANA